MEDINTCFLCMEPIQYRVLTPCDHNSLCLSCYMRNTICYHNENCYYCQNPLKGYPIVSADPKITKYSEAKSKRPFFDSQYKLFLSDKDKIREYISTLFHFVCPECSMPLQAFDMFASHVKVHKMRVCQLCYASNRFLPGDVQVFKNNKEYQNHLKSQHPRCLLCANKVFFDHDELTKHMLENHFRCDVCASLNKIEWFENAAALVEHYEKCHFLCPDCKTQGMVAFATKGELLIHQKTVHGKKMQPIDINDFASSNSADEKSDANDEQSSNREAVERRREMNRKFMIRLNELLNEDDKNQLMNAARNYVANKASAEFFYDEYARFLGTEKDVLFNDMVAFLPIPEKRAELIRIHISYNSTHDVKQLQKPVLNEASKSAQRQSNQQNPNYNRKNKNQRQPNKSQKRWSNQHQNQNSQHQNQNNQHQNQSNQHQNQNDQHQNQNNQHQNQSNQHQSQNNQHQIQIQNNPQQSKQITIQIQRNSNENPKPMLFTCPNSVERANLQVTQPKPSISISRSKGPSIVFQRSQPKEESNPTSAQPESQ